MSPSAPTLDLRDPLAELLGALPPGGTFHYEYQDVVKLSGHSCPTVAGAYLLTVVALRELYPGETPVRGEIEVTMGGPPDDGSSGPMSQVIGLITGAAPETGFHGLMGKHARYGLMRFDPKLEGRVRFRRTDTDATVELQYDPSSVPPAPEMGRLIAATLSGRASAEERQRFAKLWQERVAAILIAPTERLIRVRRGSG